MGKCFLLYKLDSVFSLTLFSPFYGKFRFLALAKNAEKRFSTILILMK